MSIVKREFHPFGGTIVPPRELYIIILNILILFILNVTEVQGQWRKLWTFEDQVMITYFLREHGKLAIGFVGTYPEAGLAQNGNDPNIGGRIWKTTDAGRSWKLVLQLPNSGVSNIIFKDTLVGWASIKRIGFQNNSGTGCYMTIDGGDTWQRTSAPNNDYVSVYYTNSTKRLFLTSWDGYSLVSVDEGVNWINWEYRTLNGFAFINDNNGIVSLVHTRDLPSPSYYLRTTDGGITWLKSALNLEAWQPLANKRTNSYYVLTEAYYGGIILKSTNYGMSWNEIYRFSPDYDPRISTQYQISGHIDIYKNNLIVNKYPEGFLVCDETESNWYSICGPYQEIDSRYFINGDTIYGADVRHMKNILGSGLWMNPTGKANGPRLQVRKSENRILHTTDRTALDILYRDESYHEKVDSVRFILKLSGDMLGYQSDSVYDGWQVQSRVFNDSLLYFSLIRTTSDTIAHNSPMLRIFYNTYLSRDTSSTITLDEVTHNQDSTFRDCMIASLTSTDTVHYTLEDVCGDSLLRHYLRMQKFIEIISVHPNPASKSVTVEYRTSFASEVIMELINTYGTTILKQTLQSHAGTNTYSLPLDQYIPGIYYIRLQRGRDAVTARFVKQ
jgi:photosystem II stability/assembly factor-like uncharacterized protein